ncbi:MAG: hypothetical protein IJ711_12730 [Lachnospiraceae bacterium]|nr:hypothetical protein [Lachnospiraceae bacterium]
MPAVEGQNRHNAQKIKKASAKSGNADKKFSTIKMPILMEKPTYTRSYTHYPQKTGQKGVCFMVTERNICFVQQS